MDRRVMTKPRKQPKSYGNGGYPSGIVKPCPTCYAPMTREGHAWGATNNGAWACPKHGAPSKP